MRLRSSRTVWRFTRLHLLVDAGDIRYAPDEPRLFSLREKLEDPKFELHAGINMAQVQESP